MLDFILKLYSLQMYLHLQMAVIQIVPGMTRRPSAGENVTGRSSGLCDATIAWTIDVLMWRDLWLSMKYLGGGLYALLFIQTVIMHGASLHPISLVAMGCLGTTAFHVIFFHVPWLSSAVVCALFVLPALLIVWLHGFGSFADGMERGCDSVSIISKLPCKRVGYFDPNILFRYSKCE